VSDAEKHPVRIAGMFDAIAWRYDLLNRVLSLGIDSRWRADAIRAAGLRPGDTVVDLCAGTCDVAIAGASSCDGLRRVMAVDVAAEMLRRGLAKIRRRKLPVPIAIVRGDASALPVRPASVDVAVVAFGIRNTQAPALVFREVHRMLRDGGRFVILEFGIPTVPVVGWLYLQYFRRILPAVGRLISHHPRAYGYLRDSVTGFSSPAAITEALIACGFCARTPVRLTCGIVYLYVAEKGAGGALRPSGL
jgi:demethylmenaquinone methyltransferase / 2-methoxy-6-polyprenyl-1,4-benzoquinol methylase